MMSRLKYFKTRKHPEDLNSLTNYPKMLSLAWLGGRIASGLSVEEQMAYCDRDIMRAME